MTRIFFLIIFLTLQLHDGFGQTSLVSVNEFGDNPGNLKMFIYPATQQDTIAKPLVVVLHGCGQNANRVSELTGWNKLADINNFIVLYPQQKFSNNPDLCFNWFMKHDIHKGEGECESIYEMIAYAEKHFPVDTNKIFITGLSAGAAMSVTMAATHPELFRGAAVFAGAAYGLAKNFIDALKVMRGNKNVSGENLIENVTEQNPAYTGGYCPLIIYQGLNDPVVNYRNASLIVRQWTLLNHCDTIPDKVEKSYMNISDITRSEYHDTLGKTIVILYSVNNLGHRLMVKPGDGDDEGGKTGMLGVDKGFHSTYHTAKDFGILKK